MRFEEDRQDQCGQQAYCSISSIDQNSNIFEPSERGQDVHVLRWQKLHLSSPGTMLFRSTLQFLKEEA